MHVATHTHLVGSLLELDLSFLKQFDVFAVFLVVSQQLRVDRARHNCHQYRLAASAIRSENKPDWFFVFRQCFRVGFFLNI